MTSQPSASTAASTRLASANRALAAALGFSTFLPIGNTYLLALLLTLGLLAQRGAWNDRLRALRWWGWGGVLVLFVAWPTLLALVGDWQPSTGSRLFHLGRVAWVLALGLVLTPRERHAALLGFLWGAAWGAAVVGAHHLWGLPDWSIWRTYLEVRGNNSSQKMIMMAMAAGTAFGLGLRAEVSWRSRAVCFGAALLFAAVVSLHAISRNAHLVLLVLPVVAMAYRWRHARQLVPAVLAVVVVVAVLWHNTPFIQPRFQAAVAEWQALAQEGNYNSSVGARGRMSLEAWRAFQTAPVWGTGVGSWETIWRNAATDFPELAGYNNPHNDYALFAMETGLPGLLLMLAIPLGLWAPNWRSRSTGGALGVLAIVTVLVSSAVNAPWRDAGLGMAMLWLMATLADTPWRRAQETM
ncbi:MAG: hypothetical protein RJA09_1537 [Pseudomonadota bacterium]